MRYLEDGSVPISVRDGTTKVTFFAADGSINVVQSTGAMNDNIGQYHPCGALNVRVSPGAGVGTYAPNGAQYISETDDNDGSLFVTVVTGALV